MKPTSSNAPCEFAWLEAIREPGVVAGWSLSDWERVVRLGYRLRLIGRLAEAVDAAGLMPGVPAQARNHLIAEQRVSRWRIAAVGWAAGRVGMALEGMTHPRLLLKGAAYISQSLPIAAGRVPSDLDILVPKSGIEDARLRLAASRWAESPMDEHDRRYYREWSHELPPMTHSKLGVELDLHHNIVPPVGHVYVDADRLIERAIPSGWPGWLVLSPADQILHSAAHLFFDSEFAGRLRDLVDLDGLLRHFGARTDGFWPGLLTRSVELRLQEPLALALHFTSTWLGTAVPPDVLREAIVAGLGPMQRAWLPALLSVALRPAEPDLRPSRLHGSVATMMLARYHFRRLPLHILIPHLWHKWRKRSVPAKPEVLVPRKR